MSLGKTSQAYRYDHALGTFTAKPDDTHLLPLGIAYFQTAAELFKTHDYQ